MSIQEEILPDIETRMHAPLEQEVLRTLEAPEHILKMVQQEELLA